MIFGSLVACPAPEHACSDHARGPTGALDKESKIKAEEEDESTIENYTLPDEDEYEELYIYL